MVEQERLEDSGIGDELMEMQQLLWPVERLRLKDFAIDMLFEYKDNDGSTLMWYQGKVVDFIREVKDKHVFVKIEWCDEYVRDGVLSQWWSLLRREEFTRFPDEGNIWTGW